MSGSFDFCMKYETQRLQLQPLAAAQHRSSFFADFRKSPLIIDQPQYVHPCTIIEHNNTVLFILLPHSRYLFNLIVLCIYPILQVRSSGSSLHVPVY